MKKTVLLLMSALVIGVSCKKEENGEVDTTPPVIGPAEGRDEIRPTPGEVRSATTDHMHVRFRVADESGIEEVLVDIHSAFDGHSHGKIAGTFNRLDYRKIYQGNGNKTLNIDSSFDDVYWDGPNSEVNGNVIAGPYDFSIAATDIHGNQTSFGNNTNYLATFYIERPYMLNVNVTNHDNGELEGQPGQELEVLGAIAQSGHSESSDIAFIWIRLYEEDDHHHKTTGEDIYERKWGTSMWRANMSGPAIPNPNSVSFEDLLTGNDAIVLPNEEEHYELEIWVEDAKGNITRRKYEVHAH